MKSNFRFSFVLSIFVSMNANADIFSASNAGAKPSVFAGLSPVTEAACYTGPAKNACASAEAEAQVWRNREANGDGEISMDVNSCKLDQAQNMILSYTFHIRSEDDSSTLEVAPCADN